MHGNYYNEGGNTNYDENGSVRGQNNNNFEKTSNIGKQKSLRLHRDEMAAMREGGDCGTTIGGPQNAMQSCCFK